MLWSRNRYHKMLKKITGRNDLTSSLRPAIIATVNSLYSNTSTNKEACQVSSEEFFLDADWGSDEEHCIDAGGGKTIFWDVIRNREVMTRQRDRLAAQAHEASGYGLGHVRSRKLRAWYTLRAEQDDQSAVKMLAYFDLLDAELEALANMSHGEVLAETEVTTPSDPHSGAPPGGEREVRPHHVATVCAGRRTKEAGHVARLHTNTRSITQ